MLTQTSELAIRALLFIGLEKSDKPLAPRGMAERLDCSPSYLAKTLGTLVKAGLLRSVRGAHGGVILGRTPDKITLLMVVEACQGMMIGNYCEEIEAHREPVCAFHTAMKEVQMLTIRTLTKYSLADLMSRPTPDEPTDSPYPCKMFFEGCEKFYCKARGGPAPKLAKKPRVTK